MKKQLIQSINLYVKVLFFLSNQIMKKQNKTT